MIPAQLIPVLITVDPLDRLVTLETCDRSDDETCPDQKKDKDNENVKYI